MNTINSSSRLMLAALLVVFVLPLAAQEFRCGVTDATALETSPEFNRAYQQKWNTYQNRALSERTTTDKSAPATYRIPTVIHIIHNCAPIGDEDRNPSDNRLLGILAETNERFRQIQPGAPTFTNPLYGPDPDIEFCLATVDPDGNFTTGIVRHDDAVLSNGDLSDIQAGIFSNYTWPSNEYFNIVLVESTDAAGWYTSNGTDRMILMPSSAVWSGLIAHEGGHYLSLAHSFQGACTNGNCLTDGDQVCDTPPKLQAGTLGSTCASPGNSCTTDDDDTNARNPYRPVNMGGEGDQPDMLANYMDYTGGCWDAFTVGQVARMHTQLDNLLAPVVAGAGTRCAFNALPARQLQLVGVESTADACNGSVSLSISFANKGSATITSAAFTADLSGTTSGTWTGSLAPNAEAIYILEVTGLAPGQNTGTLTATLVNGQADAYPGDNLSCISVFAAGGLTLPYQQSLVGACEMPNELGLNSSNDDFFQASTYHQSDLDNCLQCKLNYRGYNNSAQTAEVCIIGIDFTGMGALGLSFDYGHIPRYNFISNAMRVFLRDCSGTKLAQWERSGLNLATNNPKSYQDDGSDGIYPACNEIETVNLNLPMLNGFHDICWEVEGRYYSSMNLDNLQLSTSALPVELTSFSAQARAKDNQINWSSATEENSHYYDLERSTDGGRNFMAIHRTMSTGSGSNYRYEDEAAATQPETFYRLRAVDHDGHFTLHGPVAVLRDVSGNGGWSAAPNPVGNDGLVRLYSKVETASVEVLTLDGRRVGESVQLFGNDKTVSLAGLPRGVYLLRITGKNELPVLVRVVR